MQTTTATELVDRSLTCWNETDDAARADLIAHLGALTTLWRDDESCFAGDHIRFPVWSYPKPVQRPRPTVLLGAAGSDATLRDVVAHVDEVIVALDGTTDPRAQLDHHHHSLIERYQRSTT